VIELDGVEKVYGDATALRGVDLTVQDGEFFTLVGPSGCGKTTTLRAIAGLESLDAGTIRFDGADVTGRPPEDRNVGVVFQEYALFPTMTVRENVAYGLQFDPPEGSVESRVDDLLELVDLAGLGDRSPSELSGGQRQRVALARALAPEPDVLLLDEPLSALDARLRDRLRLEIKRIQRELGLATVYVTHDQAEALAVSDRLAVVNDGRIEQVGDPEAVYENPGTRFVAEFLGENNCLDGRAGAGGETEGSRVRVGDATFAVSGEHDGDVTLCVRPESLYVNASQNRFVARVTDVEFLGEAYRVHFDWNGRRVLARLDHAPEGDVELGFDPAAATVLD